MKNPLIKYDGIVAVLFKVKKEQGSDTVDVAIIRKEIAMNFNIIDHVAQRRFMVSIDKLGLVKPTIGGKVQICI